MAAAVVCTTGDDARVIVDSTNRGIDDLDVALWMAFITASTFVRTLATHPFLHAMTRRQASPSLAKQSSAAILRTVYKDGGNSYQALFRGFGVNVASMMLTEVAYMWLYEYLCYSSSASPLRDIMTTDTATADDGDVATRKDKGEAPELTSSSQSQRIVVDGIAGYIADASTAVVCVPFCVVANRQMCAGLAPGLAYETGWRAWSSITSGPLGVRGLFVGTAPSMLFAFSSAGWWAGYNQLKVALYGLAKPQLRALQEAYPSAPSALVSTTDNVVLNGTASSVAAVAVAVAVNPVLVLRTRMQVCVVPGVDAATPARMRDVARNIWRTEGARGFMAGTCMTAMGSVVDSLAFGFMYELSKQLTQRERRQ